MNYNKDSGMEISPNQIILILILIIIKIFKLHI